MLLTGATGFLGRHVTAAAGEWTVCTMARGPSPWTRQDFSAALTETRAEVVLHCAGALPGADAAACFGANAVLAAELLAAVSDLAGPPRVILVGSAAEYGFVTGDALPVEETHPCAPCTIYGVSKHAQTLLGLAAGAPVLVARLFNAVGVGMPRGLALASFARRIVAAGDGGEVTVGDLKARRDFIGVAEAARLLVGLAALPYWPWRVVNVCSGQAYAMGDLLDGLIAASGLRITPRIDPCLLRPADMALLVGSTRRLADVGLAPRAPDFAAVLPHLLAEARAGMAAP